MTSTHVRPFLCPGANHLRQGLSVHRAGEAADVVAGLGAGAHQGLHVDARGSQAVDRLHDLMWAMARKSTEELDC